MMQPNNLPKELIKFLKKNGALESYRANLSMLPNPGSRPSLNADWITAAFTWDGSLQGHSYWTEIDHKWSKYLHVRRLRTQTLIC